MNIKQDLYNQCLQLVDKRYKSIQNHIADIQNSLLSETKSSAGDKHETGRAMLQLEREKAGHQLAEVNKLRTALSKVDIEKNQTQVGIGSLVLTSKANYFIAVSLGQLKIDDKTAYAISPGTPIGQLLLGKTLGEEIMFNNSTFIIEKIL